MTTTERSNKNRQLIRQAGWLIAVPLLTTLTNVSWHLAAPPGDSNRLTETFLALASSLALLVALVVGVRWSIGPQRIISSATFYSATLLSLLLSLLTVTSPALRLMDLATGAGISRNPNVISGTESAYVLAAVALFAMPSALLAAALLRVLADAKNWTHRNITLVTAISCGLALISGAGLLLTSQSMALGPTMPTRSPIPLATSQPPATSNRPATPDPLTGPNPLGVPDSGSAASALPSECPVVAPSSVQALRIPIGDPESMVTSVLNTYSAWLNSGSELMRTEEWQAAPAYCTSLLAKVYGNAYISSIFTNKTGRDWLEYFKGQSELNAKLLEALRSSKTVETKSASYRLDRIIDTSTNSGGNYLKFEATLVAPTAVDWQGADRPAHWYVQLIPWQDFYIIEYVEAKVP